MCEYKSLHSGHCIKVHCQIFDQIISKVTSCRHKFYSYGALAILLGIFSKTGCKKPYKAPDPPPLIKVRMQKTDPFDVTGVDYTGALYVREKGRECKAYACLLTCAVTRAVHLEIVTDLTVKELLQT